MNILVYNWRDITHPKGGGAEVNIHEQAKRWVEKGHTVTLFCGAYKNCKTQDIIDHIHIVRKGGTFGVYVWAFLYYVFRFRGKFDFVIDIENGIPFFTPLYSFLPKLCIVHHIHKNQFFIEFSFPLNWIGYFLETKLMPLVYRKVPFITVSNTSKTNLIALGIAEDTISVIYNGINHDLYKPNFQVKNDTPSIVYLGRFKKYKRLDLLIQALPPLFEKRPDLKFYIVGKGEEEDRLKNLAKELHLEGNIVFQGFVSEEEKVCFLQKVWLLVTPSMNEGWGLTVVEANACGTPAIAFDVPGLRDSIVHGKTGLLVKENDFKIFIETIDYLIHNDTLRREMEKNSLAWSENFNWDTTAEASMKILFNAYPLLHKD